MFADADVAQVFADGAGFADHFDKLPAVGGTAHGRAAADRRPNRSDQRTDGEAPGGDLVGQLGDIIGRRVDAGVRIGQKQVNAIEPCAGKFRLGR